MNFTLPHQPFFLWPRLTRAFITRIIPEPFLSMTNSRVSMGCGRVDPFFPRACAGQIHQWMAKRERAPQSQKPWKMMMCQGLSRRGITLLRAVDCPETYSSTCVTEPASGVCRSVGFGCKDIGGPQF